MAKHVVIFGAGASKSAGAPLMVNFLDRAEQVMVTRQRHVHLEHSDFELAFRAVAELSRAHSKAVLDNRNIEAVFSAVEMADIMGRLGDMDDAVADVQQAVRTLVTQTLEASINFPLRGSLADPPADYTAFVRAIKQSDARSDIALLTFNYDIALDFALRKAGAGFAPYYALEDAPFNGQQQIPLLKLHGSIHWAQERDHPFRTHVQELGQPGSIPVYDDQNSYQWPISTATLRGAEVAGLEDPELLIVPPTWSKGEHYKRMRTVWNAAGQHLRDAQSIYVIGYSMPETDQFFRYLYGLGTLGNTRLRRFWVMNPDRAAGKRFLDLGGQAVQQPVFRYIPEKFDTVAPRMAKAFLKPYDSADEDCGFIVETL